MVCINLSRLSENYFSVSNGIKKSINDPLNYHYKLLPNGIKVLFIEDQTTLISALSLTVSVGSIHDYNEFNGIAHFLEHMLFMGSKSYPDESLFLAKVNSYGGVSNAFTANTATCYYFQVPVFSFLEIADIFSSFLHEPLFNPSAIEREINAITAEHEKNIINDSWRFLQILKKSVNQDHPFSKFSTGNKESLLSHDGKKELLREALIKFFTSYYLPTNMTLLVYTSSIKTIEPSINNYFGRIRNRNKITYNIPQNVFKKNINQNTQVVTIKTIDNKNRLQILFEVPNIFGNNIGLEIIDCLFTKKNKMLLYDILQNYKYIYKIKTEIIANFKKTQILAIKLKLTDQGYINYMHVIDIINMYIKHLLLYDMNIYKIIYSEIIKINRLNFINHQIQKPLDILQNYIFILINMPEYDLKLLPIYQIFGLDFISTYKYVINVLIEMDIKKSIILKGNNSIDVSDYEEEKYYKIYYKSENMILQLSKGINENFAVIHNNKYILSKILITPNLYQINNYPVEIINKNKKNNKHKFYIDFNNEFKVLQISSYIDIIFPLIYDNELQYPNYIKSLALNIYIYALKKEYEYLFDEMSNAGYDVIIDVMNDKIRLVICGWTEHFINVFLKIFDLIVSKKHNISVDSFEYAHEIIYKELHNHKFNQPYIKINDVILQKLCPHYISIKDLLNGLQEIRQYNIVEVYIKLFDKTLISCLFGGNINDFISKEIIKFAKKINKYLCVYDKPYLKKLCQIDKDYEIINNDNQDDTNIALQYMVKLDTIDYTDSDWKKKVCYSLLLNNISSNIYFDNMRTKQQLGYIVLTKVEPVNTDPNQKELYISFITQSPIASLDILIEKTLLCIKNIRNILNEMKEESFEIIKKGLIDSISQKYKNLDEKMAYYKEIILSDNIIFDKKYLLVENMKTISKSEYINYFDDKLMDRSQIFIAGINRF